MASVYSKIQDGLEKYEFITIIGKYDHVLGPISLFSSFQFNDNKFIRNLLRDALNTKNKFVILDHNQFYSQVCKIEIEDLEARGEKQLYAIILLRDSTFPLIPTIHFQRIEMLFHKLGVDTILKDDIVFFEKFFNEINNIYKRKEEILPIEKFHLKMRSGINTIQGFCELIQEMVGEVTITNERLSSYIEMILDSCNEVTQALESQFKK